MKTITERLKTTAIEITKNAVSGLLCGYIYSKLADLPTDRVVKCWIINDVVIGCISDMTTSFIEDKIIKNLTQHTVITIGSVAFIYQMRKLELLGDKMMYMLIVMNTIKSIAILVLTVGFLKNKYEKPPHLSTDYWSVFSIVLFKNFYANELEHS